MSELINIAEEIKLSLLVVIVSFISLLYLINYVLLGVGLYKISKKMKKNNNWMAWIPGLNYYYLGEVSISSLYGVLVLLFSSLTAIFDRSLLGIILCTLIYMVLNIISFNRLYNDIRCKRKKYKYLTICTLGILGPLFVFILRNKKI